MCQQTDGSYRLKNTAGDFVALIFMLEVKEDWGQGGGSPPLMQLLSYFSKYVVEQAKMGSPAFRMTSLPSLGIELYGNTFRLVWSRY